MSSCRHHDADDRAAVGEARVIAAGMPATTSSPTLAAVLGVALRRFCPHGPGRGCTPAIAAAALFVALPRERIAHHQIIRARPCRAPSIGSSLRQPSRRVGVVDAPRCWSAAIIEHTATCAERASSVQPRPKPFILVNCRMFSPFDPLARDVAFPHMQPRPGRAPAS